MLAAKTAALKAMSVGDEATVAERDEAGSVSIHSAYDDASIAEAISELQVDETA